jgi:hypothetical protein
MTSPRFYYSRQDFVDFLGHLEDLLDLYVQDDMDAQADMVRNVIAEIDEFLDPDEGEPGTQSFEAQGRLHILEQWYKTALAGSKANMAIRIGSGRFYVMPMPTVICP